MTPRDGRPRLVVIGGGKMGGALVRGLVAAGWAVAAEIAVVERLEARRSELAQLVPGVQLLDEPVPGHGVVIAVKPADVQATCEQVAAGGAGSPVLSIAAAVHIADLERWLAPGTPVVRAMPNTPALLGAGAAAVAAGTAASEDHLRWAEGLLGAVGIVTRVTEAQLDAVTGLSGSGPAYVFLVAEALIEAGVHAGLPHDVSTTLALQTLLGAARMLTETGDAPDALRAQVTTPGGTTAAGLRVLEDRALRAALVEAVEAAAARSREMS